MQDITSQVIPISNLLDGIETELKSRDDVPKLSIKSLPELNRAIWGLKPAALTVIGARTSQGKSAFSLQLAYDLANQNIPVLFLSLEMVAEDLVERLFCNLMEVDNYSLKAGLMKFDNETQERWRKFKQLSSEIPLLITSGIGKNYGEVQELIELLDPKPKVIFIDFIQNISARPRETRETINEFILQFRNMALKHRFAGVLCSQINRGAAGNAGSEPTMYQLKETGALEEFADVCLLLHWENFYDHSKDQSQYKVIIAKNRSGKTGDHALKYEPQFYRFSEVN